MNELLSSFTRKIIAAIQTNRITIAVWLLIAIVVFAAVAANHAAKSDMEAKLSSSDASVRQAEVLRLAQQRTLADSLTSTEDPNSPATSPQNSQSATVRESAAATLDQLIKQGQLPPDVALDNLFALRKDSDAAVGKSATSGIAMIGAQNLTNLKMVVARLSDGDPDVRSAASDALGQIGGAQAASLVAPLMKDAASQDAAASALTKIGPPAVPYLTAQLSGASLDLQTQIIDTLAAIGDPSAIPALAAQANVLPPDPTVHREAVIALSAIVLKNIPAPGSTPPPAAIAAAPAATAPVTPPPAAVVVSPANMALVRSTTLLFTATLTSTSEDSFARTRSALALGRLGGSGAVTALIGTLGDFDTRVAGASGTALQQIGQPAVSALATAAQSPNDSVRIAAGSALGGIATPDALTAIHRSLADPSPDVRAAAATALGMSANKDAVALLVPLLSDSSGAVADAAGNSLHLLGNVSLAPLVAALGSPSPTAAFYASQALDEMGPVAAPAVEQALTGSGSDTQKIWAAVTLGHIHDPNSRTALASAAAGGSPGLRWAAGQALQQLGQA